MKRWNLLRFSSPLLMCFLLHRMTLALGTPYPYPHPTMPPQKPPCGSYGQEPCAFVPAPKGMTPKCVTPGATFCEANPDYPAYLIKHLVESLGYQRIVANEERIDFSANKPVEEEEHLHHHYHHFYGSFSPMEPAKPSSKPAAPGPAYGYLAPVQQMLGSMNYEHKRPAPIPQPIYIPKPRHSYHYNTHARAPLYNRPAASSSGGQGYYYPSPAGSAPVPATAPVTQYSPADWLKRFARDLSDKHQREVRLGALRRADESVNLFDSEPAPFRRPAVLNETTYERVLAKNRPKRQTEQVRETLCSVRERYITPQTALNTKGNWMFVVNQENSRQLVKTEICASTECSNLCSFPVGYSSRCEQRYVQKRLLTLDPSGQTLYVDTYWFPSCCVCSLYAGN